MNLQQVASSIVPASPSAHYEVTAMMPGVDGESSAHYVYLILHGPTDAMYIGQRTKAFTDGNPIMLDEYGGSPSKSNHMYDLQKTRPAEEFAKTIVKTFTDREESFDFEGGLIRAAWNRFGKVADGGLVCNLKDKTGLPLHQRGEDSHMYGKTGKDHPAFGRTTTEGAKHLMRLSCPHTMAVVDMVSGDEYISGGEVSPRQPNGTNMVTRSAGTNSSKIRNGVLPKASKRKTFNKVSNPLFNTLWIFKTDIDAYTKLKEYSPIPKVALDRKEAMIEVARMDSEGMSRMAIASCIGMSYSTVGNWLRASADG